ncbi:MAG: hypothetical protein KFH98_10930 [Gemmatimonadetes bacterium]|nr:hypothetical protein [Gemmatimonadota bacterium]
MTRRPPYEPTAAVKPATRGRGDTPPPVPPHELRHEPADEREFEDEGRNWIARLGGKGACGTGSYGLGLVEAVHFFDAGEPERPLREALLARGRFDGMYDAELSRLLRTARPIQNAS